jgi:SanA protein
MLKTKRSLLIIKSLGAAGILGLLIIFGVSAYVVVSTSGRIKTLDEVSGDRYDCILVLGAGVWEGNKPSPMLEDRLLKSIQLYQAGIAPKIIMSGDHGTESYDEVNVMKKYAIDHGVPSEDIFMDHAGFSTYDSVYRAIHIFEAKKVLVVTQEYHLYRALYIANQLGLSADGVAAEKIAYSNQWIRDLREVLARDKDVVKSLLKPKSTYLGDPIPLDQSGDVTNDQD